MQKILQHYCFTQVASICLFDTVLVGVWIVTEHHVCADLA